MVLFEGRRERHAPDHSARFGKRAHSLFWTKYRLCAAPTATWMRATDIVSHDGLRRG